MAKGFSTCRVLMMPVLVAALSGTAFANENEGQIDRVAAQAVIRDLRKITSEKGVEELKAVRIGGVEQWISVRGRDRDNPILLFIHGGPAVTEMPASWFYQTPWEDFFTVVQWDQRGAGKTMASSTPEAAAAGMNVERFVSDAEELVAYLRQTYGKKKIFILGHSWGTIIGLQVAQRHPDWLHAYIGMGQAVSFEENEQLGTRFALEQAEAQNHSEAIRELRAISPYAEPGRPIAIDKPMTQRKWLTYFGGLTRGRRDFTFEENAGKLSPDYTLADLAASEQAGITVMAVVPELAKLSLFDVTRLDCPVFILAGQHDHATSSVLAERWFSRLSAPSKRLIKFDGVAHEIQFEAPGRLLMHLVNDVRPIAIKAGDGVDHD